MAEYGGPTHTAGTQYFTTDYVGSMRMILNGTGGCYGCDQGGSRFREGLTGGAGLACGALERSIDGDAETDAFDLGDVGADAAGGLIGGAAGRQIQVLLRAELPLPEWAKIKLREANRMRRIAKGRT